MKQNRIIAAQFLLNWIEWMENTHRKYYINKSVVSWSRKRIKINKGIGGATFSTK